MTAVNGAVIAVTGKRPGAIEPVVTDATRASLTTANYSVRRDSRERRERRDRRRISSDGTPDPGLRRRDRCDQRRVR